MAEGGGVWVGGGGVVGCEGGWCVSRSEALFCGRDPRARREGQLQTGLSAGLSEVGVVDRVRARPVCSEHRRDSSRSDEAASGVSFLFVSFLWTSKEKRPAIRRNKRVKTK